MIELVIISVLFAAFVTGVIILNTISYLSNWDFPGFMFMLVGGIGVLICAIVFPVERITNYGKIDAFEATRMSYENMRADQRDFESFSIYEDIAENNRWLAERKRYRAMGFTFVIPAEVDDLEPIR